MNAPDRSLSGMQVIDIKPLPPSLNNMFVNVRGRGRIKSDRYRTWINAAGWDVKLAKAKPIHGPVRVSILINRPNKRSDLDNLVKPILDLLVTHGVLIDDSQVMALSTEWSDVVEGVRIFLEPWRKAVAA